ncbi:hypothetical protein TAMA11512_17680 [Selenomonas sp. TAMA-11512]|uniref:hypothetical protein n=1 Tax=Selenomonas sp. TAMA-11512 TaxID=3095337 RepID=UPI0030891FA3|nr:hypothetical protein TAMA11512_17680 [Selenomonas sp. TAMA-11512]
MKRKFAGLLLVVSTLFAFTGCGGGGGDSASSNEYQDLHLVMTVNGTNIATDTKTALHFAEEVEKESGGKIKIDVFPNDQLAGGNMTKGVEMVADGAVDLAAYATVVLGTLDQRLVVAGIPWTFDNYQQARKVIDSTGGAL